MSAFDPDAAAAADSGVYGLAATLEQSAVVLLPVPFAATVSYGGGAEHGPAAILAASRQVDLYDWHFGRVYEQGICMLSADPRIGEAHLRARAAARPVLDAGGVAAGDPSVSAIDADGALVNGIVEQEVERLLAEGRIPGVVGGDHSVPFGAIAAAARRHPGLGILHFDAHADLRDAYEGFRWSHASIMHNVLRECDGVSRVVQLGIRDFGESELRAIHSSEGRVLTHFDAEWQRQRFAGRSFDELVAQALEPLPTEVWVSFDIDGLDPALCPNTGTPVPGGLQFAEAAHILHALAVSGRRIVGFDLVEVAPGVDGEWDANVGARLLYKLCGAALRSRSS